VFDILRTENHRPELKTEVEKDESIFSLRAYQQCAIRAVNPVSHRTKFTLCFEFEIFIPLKKFADDRLVFLSFQAAGAVNNLSSNPNPARCLLQQRYLCVRQPKDFFRSDPPA